LTWHAIEMALLADLQRVFENTYGLEAGVDLEQCLVGPIRCAELSSRSGEGRAELSDWARFFYYVEDRNLRLAIFYADDVIAALEARDPRRSLTESNVLPFLVFAEELSHALHTTLAFAEGGPGRVVAPAFLHELELLARVDAYLILRHFVERHARRFTASDRAWVRQQAVSRWDVPYDDPALAARYRATARLAGRFVDHLERLDSGARLAELRRLRGLDWPGKRRRIARLN
jgi:hypothetical protein